MATHQRSDLPLQAVSLRCEGCGGTFGVLPTPGQASCPYCQREQLVSALMLGQLQQYDRAVQIELAQAEAALDRAGAGKAFRKEYRGGRMKYIVATIFVSHLLIVAVSLSVPVFHVDAQAATVVTYALVAFMFAGAAWAMARPAAQPAAASTVEMSSLRVACSNCGAVTEMAGAAAHHCPYCRTAIVASRAVIQHGVNAAMSARRQAQLEELREKRRIATTVTSPDASNVPYFVGGFFVLLGLSQTLRTVLAAQRGDSIDEIADFYVPLALTLALVIGMPALFFFRASRRNRCRSAMRTLLAAYPTLYVETREELVDWLNSHWPAAYDMYSLGFGRYFLCAQTTLASYPLLVRGNLWPPAAEGLPSLHLLLAAQFPPAESVPVAAKQAAQRALEHCRSFGFELQVSEAGVLASATADKLHGLRRSPRELGELGSALQALVAAAAAVNALPG